MDFGFEIPSYDRILPKGYRHCNWCHNDLPEDRFGTNPMLGKPYLWCRECFAKEAKTLSHRLEWYVATWKRRTGSKETPPLFPEGMGTDHETIRRWLIENAETPVGARTAMAARNMSAPGEEVDRLIQSGRIDSIDVAPGAAKLEKDPYAGYKERYREWEDAGRGRGIQ